MHWRKIFSPEFLSWSFFSIKLLASETSNAKKEPKDFSAVEIFFLQPTRKFSFNLRWDFLESFKLFWATWRSVFLEDSFPSLRWNDFRKTKSPNFTDNWNHKTQKEREDKTPTLGIFLLPPSDAPRFYFVFLRFFDCSLGTICRGLGAIEIRWERKSWRLYFCCCNKSLNEFLISCPVLSLSPV